MLKKIIIPLVIGIIGLSMIAYLALSSRKEIFEADTPAASNAANSANVVEKIGQAQVLENYKSGIRPLLESYNIVFSGLDDGPASSSGSSTAATAASGTSSSRLSGLTEEVARIRKAASVFIVPENFRNMHLKMILSLSMLDNYIETKSLADKARALAFYEEVKADSQGL